MTTWLAHIRVLLAGALTFVALAYLQTVDSEKGILFALCAYAIIAVAFLVALGTTRDAAMPDRFCVVATVLFFAYLTTRALFSPVEYVARADLYGALGTVIVYALLLTAFAGANRRLALCVALLAFGNVHVLVSVVQFGLGRNYDLLFPALANVEASSRGSGFYVDPDHLAGLLEVLGIVGLSITAWSRWPNWARVCIGYLTAICYFGLILTGSRGGYISTVASLIVFSALSFLALRKAGGSRLLKFGGIGFAILAVLLVGAWLFIHENAYLQQKLHTITDVDRGRIRLWQAAIEQWKMRPLLGTGSGTYLFFGRQLRSPLMQSDPVDVHNDYLNLLSDYGILGGIGFLIFFLAHLHNGWRAFAHFGPKRIAAGSSLRSDRLALNIGALSAIASYVVHSAVDFNLHIPANALALALVFGVLANPGLHFDNSSRLMHWTQLSFGILAAVLFLQCARLIPGEFFAEKARIALMHENPTAAIDFAQKALGHETKNPGVFFYLGRALVALGNAENQIADRPALYERALQAFDRARQLAPLDEIYPLEMARIYDRTNRFEEAEAMFAIARARDPRSDVVAALYAAHLEMWKNSPNE